MLSIVSSTGITKQADNVPCPVPALNKVGEFGINWQEAIISKKACAHGSGSISGWATALATRQKRSSGVSSPNKYRVFRTISAFWESCNVVKIASLERKFLLSRSPGFYGKKYAVMFRDLARKSLERSGSTTFPNRFVIRQLMIGKGWQWRAVSRIGSVYVNFMMDMWFMVSWAIFCWMRLPWACFGTPSGDRCIWNREYASERACDGASFRELGRIERS